MADGDAGSVKERVAEMGERRDALLKATVIAARGQTHTAPYQDEHDQYFEGTGAIVPPYEPGILMLLLEYSNSLRQCVDAYVTNIDAFGHRFEPIVDLNAADADDRLTSYIMARRMQRNTTTIADPTHQVPTPTAEELAKAKLELAERMRAERMKIEHFFEFACLDYSFVTLRRRTRQDLEQMGNAYWEVIRDECGRLAGFEYVPSFTVRHMKQDHHATPVDYKVKINEFDYGQIPTRRHFRRFIQVFETRVTYFKEFGDPRPMSAKTGRYFRDEVEMRTWFTENPDDTPASEMIHFRIHTAKSSYGIPRWIGCILAVMGSRQAEEVNLSYFENKSVPPLAVLVQGGRMTEESVARVSDFIENEIKGKRNFHKILVLEAEGQGAGGFDQGRMKIDLKPLTSAQHNDALFQQYDQNNIDKVGMSFRLPRMLRGDIRDFNRATAESALQFAESQVFGPERDEFDFTINRKILPALNIRFWKFKSHTASATNPIDLTSMVADLMNAGALTPAEAREIVGEQVFHRELRKINDAWVRQPISLTEKGVTPPEAAPGTAVGPNAPTGDTPLGGAAMAGAPAAGPSVGAGGSVSITGTDAASVVTVNEARASMGLGNLQLPNGGDDPDGFLTIAEFKAKGQAAGQAVGTAEGQSESGQPGAQEAPGAASKDDMGTGDLASGGGLAVPSQGRRFRKLPPHYPNQTPESKRADILSMAADLLALRKTMSAIELAEIEAQFAEQVRQAKALEKQDEEIAAGE